MPYDDEAGVRQFFLANAHAHDQQAAAILSKIGVQIGTGGLMSQAAEDALLAVMRAHVEGHHLPPPQPLRDWMRFHVDAHNAEYNALQAGQIPDEIAVADFSSPAAFYDWLTVHQALHDGVAQVLGLS